MRDMKYAFAVLFLLCTSRTFANPIIILELKDLIRRSDLVAIVTIDSLIQSTPPRALAQVTHVLKGPRVHYLELKEPYGDFLRTGRFLVFLTRTKTGYEHPGCASFFLIENDYVYWTYRGIKLDKAKAEFGSFGYLKEPLQSAVNLVQSQLDKTPKKPNTPSP